MAPAAEIPDSIGEKMEIHLSRGEFLRLNRDNGRNMGKADEIRAVS